MEEDLTLYKVVVNHEEQYSIWPRRQGKRPRLERCRQRRQQGRMPRIHQGSVDGYAAAQLAEENGGG